ncbi:MAG: CPBP family intramembrane glutamic endopeptidase [Bacteroidota bacterium]
MQIIDVLFNYRLFSYFITYIFIGVPLFIGTYFINNNYNILNNLGLSKNILRGLVLAIIFTLPMFIGGHIFYKFNQEIIISKLIAGTIFAGFFEELYFRGFLFGQIFRNTKLGFLPSIIIGALVFAAAHLYQSRDISTMTGIFITTFMGAIFFAWLFVEWDYNLWVPVFMHTLMNLSWILFNISDNALGNINSNIFRGLTIAVAIILTILYKRKQGQTLSINRNTLLKKI